MALENASQIQQLVPANPPGTDPLSEADDHLRMIKNCLQNSLPGLTAPWDTTNTIKAADPVDARDLVTLQYLQNPANSAEKIGYPFLWMLDALPSADHIEFNGQELNRSTYAALFALYGTTYGAGDGSTTFRVPNVRGLFPRFMDNGAGVDPNAGARTARPDGQSGDKVGTTQLDEFKSHAHTTDLRGISFASGGAQGVYYTAGNGTISTLSTGGAETRGKNIYFRLICRAK